MRRTRRATSASSRGASGSAPVASRSRRAVIVTVLSLSEAMELGVGRAVGGGVVGGEEGPSLTVAVAPLLVVVGADVGRIPPTHLEGGPRGERAGPVGPRPEEARRGGRQREHALLEGLRREVGPRRLQGVENVEQILVGDGEVHL